MSPLLPVAYPDGEVSIRVHLEGHGSHIHCSISLGTFDW